MLQWFTGNIGFHHIHHLSPRIPNYNLQKCHESDRLFEQVKPITLASSLKCLTFRFWDEQGRKLVGHAYLRQFKREQHACAVGGGGQCRPGAGVELMGSRSLAETCRAR